ncbi:MAG TPA: hypothetical protein VFL41_13530 [Gaiellaceae bacterium]|nr:hypothetical protein [Gaiellaceae bacterium]
MRLPIVSLTACSAALVLVVAPGCGGEQNASPEPGIAAAAARDLAVRSERVAELAPVNECAAAHAADELDAAAEHAVAERQVDPALRRELLARTQELVDELNCPPPPTTTDEDDGDNGNDNGKGKGKDKPKRKHKGDEG